MHYSTAITLRGKKFPLGLHHHPNTFEQKRLMLFRDKYRQIHLQDHA